MGPYLARPGTYSGVGPEDSTAAAFSPPIGGGMGQITPAHSAFGRRRVQLGHDAARRPMARTAATDRHDGIRRLRLHRAIQCLVWLEVVRLLRGRSCPSLVHDYI